MNWTGGGLINVLNVSGYGSGGGATGNFFLLLAGGDFNLLDGADFLLL